MCFEKALTASCVMSAPKADGRVGLIPARPVTKALCTRRRIGNTETARAAAPQQYIKTPTANIWTHFLSNGAAGAWSARGGQRVKYPHVIKNGVLRKSKTRTANIVYFYRIPLAHLRSTCHLSRLRPGESPGRKPRRVLFYIRLSVPWRNTGDFCVERRFPTEEPLSCRKVSLRIIAVLGQIVP